MSTVFGFLKPFKLPIFIALFLMLLELFVELIHPLLLAKIIDDGIIQEDFSVIVRWGGLMVGLSFLAFIAGVVNSFYAAHVSQSTGFLIRSSMYQKIQMFAFSQLQCFETSSLITRLTNDVTQIQNTIFMSLRIMLRAPLLIVGGAIMALFINVKIALILVIAIPLIVLFLIWMMKKGGTLFSQVQAKLDKVNHVMRENLTAMRLVKMFVRSKHENKRFKKGNEQLMNHTVSALRLMELTMPVLLFLMNVGVMAILWFGSFEVNSGGAQVGEIVAIVNYATRITSALTVFSMIIIVFSRARASAERISEVLEHGKEQKDEQLEKELEKLEGSLTFDHVSFQYPNTQGDVLKEVSFHVEKGKTLAILGATGSGKSTLVQLIPKLYEVNKGNIFIDSFNIDDLSSFQLRDQIGYVPQEVFLFSGTIKENIQWGKPEASIEDVIEAAKHAQIHDLIEQLPDQYETKIGQKGVNLSGGQKQRLSIARALLRKPKLLLLDDCTSALDVKTEGRFLEALEDYSCTTLLITQKISSAIKADQIILLEDGQIIAEGTHEQLAKKSTLYQAILQSQEREEERVDV
ncbi:lipid A export ATP-binding/permease protein MsbA [Halalkalibacter wakoensis JCM 9140]|uniref:Lipid A export ATP-binding/permease protein MsbA n=1 Tax=Halalkalibacter wakoensis JCM 9140 TaxID=1236970 RepID=W4Q2E5_9BACI|nr:ABC transporter ATP-binding protein [Halalkalibacter wakoensis]GAE26110.1 lipid A export ATP-binding/permease protein MsbA [Halalkalibacter wakoensis JCM 9140]